MDHNFSPLVNRFESAAVMLLNVENDEPGHKDRPSVPHFSDLIHMNWAGSFTKKFAGLVFALSAFCVSDGPGIIRVRESYLNHLNDGATWNLPCHIAWTALAYAPSWSLIIRDRKGKKDLMPLVGYSTGKGKSYSLTHNQEIYLPSLALPFQDRKSVV